ncbi:hypothetical protein, partial [Actinokineospora sp.]|uniref:hypothetical protein n=1 Tax=Actinokineospora sp. TaxID=1872133 RepID=UPI003D6B3913
KALLALSSQDRYFAAALSSDVAKFVAAPTLARAVAMKVLAEEGPLGLVWHYALVDDRVAQHIATDNDLGDALLEGQEELENIESEDHDERLARWLGMSPREREVLRALAGRTASPMPLTAAWLDKLQAALRRMRSHAENIGGLAVLYHTTRPDMAIWAGLWEGDSELRDARERGETEVAEFDDGGEDTRAQIWEDLPSEGRVMLTELSTIASNWSRSDARMLEQARAALAADGDLGLHVFLREPGQDWRLTVDLGDQLTAADAKAGSAVRVFDSASFDERLAAWATFPQRQRDLLVQVSVGARNVRMRVEGFMHQVLNQVHNGTLAELWQCWQRNSLHVAVNLNAPDQSLLADALGQARILITEIVPACRDLDDEVLAQWVTKQNEFTLREVAAADKDLARRIAVITAGNTTRPTDGSGSERTASTTTPTTTTTTVPTRDAALDSTIRAMPPGDVHRFVHGEDVDTDTLLEMLIHSITHHD